MHVRVINKIINGTLSRQRIVTHVCISIEKSPFFPFVVQFSLSHKQTINDTTIGHLFSLVLCGRTYAVDTQEIVQSMCE